MKPNLVFTLLFAATLATAMDNPDIIAPSQHISLLQSFLLATDFKVTKDNVVTYPHYKDKARLFCQGRQDAAMLLWQAHGQPIKDSDNCIKTKENDIKCTKLMMELYESLDRTHPLGPQLSPDTTLILQTYLFRRFFTHKDLDKNDDLLITNKGVKTLITAQQKHILTEYRKSLEDFLIEVSGSDKITKIPTAPSVNIRAIVCVEPFLTAKFNFIDTLPPEFIAISKEYLANVP